MRLVIIADKILVRLYRMIVNDAYLIDKLEKPCSFRVFKYLCKLRNSNVKKLITK